jgi:hypothetical protein
VDQVLCVKQYKFVCVYIFIENRIEGIFYLKFEVFGAEFSLTRTYALLTFLICLFFTISQLIVIFDA